MANVSNIITAAVGAIVISTACVSAAVVPATTAGKAPASYALASVPASTQSASA
jgi:hypothetical protein